MAWDSNIANGSWGGGGGAGSSQSSSFIPNYSQSPFLQAIASYAGQLGDATYNWGQQQYAKTSNITDQNINSYLTTSANALANAQSDQQRYQTLFQPQENSLIADANSYNSTARQQFEMGRAESTAGAGMDVARQNHERELQSFGIDPSSGRYDELDRADQLAKSATQVAAGQQAYQNTAATGRQLRADAIQVGERYPGQITNEQNTALQGVAGAENSNLASANTGIALQNSANPYLSTAESLKYPPLGTASRSISPASGGGGGGGGQSPSSSSDPNASGGSSGGGGRPASRGTSGGGGGSGSSQDPNSAYDPNGTYAPDAGSSGTGDVFNNGSGVDYTGADSNPFSSASGSGSDAQNYSNSSYAPSDGSVFDTGSGTDYSGGGNYAQGGAIPDAGPHAGPVPRQMSPSGGRQVDDVHARGPGGQRINLNADEFVIPRDVAQWKGQEFFQKLIMDARKNNAMAAAKPRMHAGAAQ